jgi:GDP-D-mannose 3', 5'-epimerase
MKTALVCGSSGLLGSHMVLRLKEEGYYVTGVDIKHSEFSPFVGDVFHKWDLTSWSIDEWVGDFGSWDRYDEVYQFAAEMGGAEYIFTGANDAQIMHSSALINLNVLEACRQAKVGKVFFSSSACIYPEFFQMWPNSRPLREIDAYPARPDSAYGWEKLFAEQLYESYARNYGLQVRIGRIHNCFGTLSTYRGGREKAPAAIARKVAEAEDYSSIDIIGDGKQTRSFLYIDECIEGIRRLMQSDFQGPVNIGSSELVSINQLAEMLCEIAGKKLAIKHVPGPQGVRGRCSDNTLIQEKLGWAPSASLRDGLAKLYPWIASRVMGVDTALEKV